MAHIRANTTSGTQVLDVYLALKSLLTAEGWSQIGPDILDTNTNLTWYVWRCPSANTTLGKDYHIALGHATTGTGSMYVRMFEDYLGEVVPGEYHCQRPVPIGPTGYNERPWIAGDEAYSVPNTGRGVDGKKLYGATNSTSYPVPLFQGPVGSQYDYRNFERDNADGDYSVGVFATNISSADAPSEEKDILEGGPHTFDFRSFYIDGGMTLLADDSTAVEYVIHVRPDCFMISTSLIFEDQYDAWYVGAYEPLSPFDPFPICFMDFRRSGYMAFTREFAHDPNLPPTITGSFNSRDDFFESEGKNAWTPAENIVHQTIDQINKLDSYNKGPLASRLYIKGGGLGFGSHYRGLGKGVLVTDPASAVGVPPIQMGDEATINGNPYYFIGNVTGETGTIIRPETGVTNITGYYGLWFPKA